MKDIAVVKKSEPVESQSNRHSARRFKDNRWLILVAFVLMSTGAYLLYLTQAPKLPNIPFVSAASIDLNTKDDATDNRDRIQIEKINLEVPFYTGGSADVLEKGAWHRYPDRGDPQKGGNFILSAHRFRMAATPWNTKEHSPFYNIDQLNVGDSMRVYFNGKWYDYEVTKKYRVNPDAVSIETPSKEAKLTLYSCTLGGSADGRDVIEAKLRK